MSLKFDQFPIRPLTVGRFWSWLARSEPGAALEYHRGLLILDRSPASELGEDERRTVAKIADAALAAAEDGLVHLVQRRQRPVRLQLRRDQGRTGARQARPHAPCPMPASTTCRPLPRELAMGSSFERHGIDHLSASSLNLWAAEPALWVMERLLGRRSPTSAVAARGKAVEQGVHVGLMHPEREVAACIAAAEAAFDREMALTPDGRRDAERAQPRRLRRARPGGAQAVRRPDRLSGSGRDRPRRRARPGRRLPRLALRPARPDRRSQDRRAAAVRRSATPTGARAPSTPGRTATTACAWRT